jgi:hypothetical protein
LRLRWQWQARAAFGPIEHQTIVENLGNDEIWLPMVDSLSLDWLVPASRSLRNFYVEKGADTPSAQGAHLDAVEEGYRWTGSGVHTKCGATGALI